jgi:hypothetical protein
LPQESIQEETYHRLLPPNSENDLSEVLVLEVTYASESRTLVDGYLNGKLASSHDVRIPPSQIAKRLSYSLYRWYSHSMHRHPFQYNEV